MLPLCMCRLHNTLLYTFFCSVNKLWERQQLNNGRVKARSMLCEWTASGHYIGDTRTYTERLIVRQHNPIKLERISLYRTCPRQLPLKPFPFDWRWARPTQTVHCLSVISHFEELDRSLDRPGHRYCRCEQIWALGPWSPLNSGWVEKVFCRGGNAYLLSGQTGPVVSYF